jgi:hypothetical protein
MIPFALVLLLVVTLPARAATGPAPAVGGSATYRWTSSLRQEVPVIVRQEGPGGSVSWSVAQETVAPAPLFVTYSIVASDATSYTLQITTHQTPDGPPLSVTQIRVDRASGKALRSVTRTPKGAVATPESALRPFRQSDVKGTEEAVTVPAGQFTAIRAAHRDGTVWVSDRVPALGLVKATSPSGTLELVKSGTAGAKDLLRS